MGLGAFLAPTALNLPHLGVLGSEPVRSGALSPGGPGLGGGVRSACGKGPSPQLAWGPTPTGQQPLSRGGRARLGEWGQGSGWGSPGPLSGWEAPASPGAPLTSTTPYSPSCSLLLLPRPQAPFPHCCTWLNSCSAQEPPPLGSLLWTLLPSLSTVGPHLRTLWSLPAS